MQTMVILLAVMIVVVEEAAEALAMDILHGMEQMVVVQVIENLIVQVFAVLIEMLEIVHNKVNVIVALGAVMDIIEGKRRFINASKNN
ncbi:MAG: hypothetical protein SPI94_07040 [Candidatus Onthovivens sp.]|nr:hypothetical protein [Candidatus Onthovivens sp.]